MSQEHERQVFGNRWAGDAGATGGDGPIIDHCACIAYVPRKRAQGPTRFHPDLQDASAPGWIRLLELIEQAVDDGREVFKAGHRQAKCSLRSHSRVHAQLPNPSSLCDVRLIRAYRRLRPKTTSCESPASQADSAHDNLAPASNVRHFYLDTTSEES